MVKLDPLDVNVELRTLLGRQGGVLTWQQGVSALGDRTMRRAGRARALTKLWANCYCLAGRETEVPVLLAGADLTLGRRAVACLGTAAHLHGFGAALPATDTGVHVLAPARHQSRLAPLHLHRVTPIDPLVHVRGRPVTSAADTAVAVAARMPSAMHALAVLDAAARSGSTSTDELADRALRARYRGSALVRTLVSAVDPRAESAAESWTRWACAEFGLPAPVPQLTVRGSDGRWYRLDLGWEQERVGLEYDGVAFHTGAHLESDRRRLNALTGAGWQIFSLTGAVFWTPERDRVLAAVARALRERSLSVAG